ncbi:unnamed protein product [Miscanthus lutarioriparius]|uniref:Uncharacterized protein n=1 Tax=Miscanthus lutarioriparius TaxID=422564 RepID=A0A811RCP6_9POAL|nr:unnamed protein product [Miscanthus lutarioriparius]
MDPALQLILDTMNSRFDDLDRRFAYRDQASADRDAVVDSRFYALAAATSAAATTAAALEQRLAGLESFGIDHVAASMEQRLSSLEASYVDRDTEYTNRINEFESLRVADMTDDRDARVAALEKATTEFAAWRPDMEGVLDDVWLRVEKIDSKCDLVVFDKMPHRSGLLPHPSPAATVAKQHLDKAVARWFQFIEPELDFSDWLGFCRLLHDRFDRDQKELLMRQLFHAKQTTLEEAGSASVPWSPRPGDWFPSTKAAAIPRTALPLPLPPTRQDKIVSQAPATLPASDSKLAAIKSYRRALGLCFKCGMKWSKDHKCSPEVLHAVEILWESFPDEDGQSSAANSSGPDEQLCLALSKAASCGSPSSRTIRFQGSIAGIPAVLLHDSGSSTSFVSMAIAAQLPQFPPVPQRAQVQIAGGGSCTAQVLCGRFHGQWVHVSFALISGYWICLPLMLSSGWIGFRLLAPCRFIGSRNESLSLTTATGQSCRALMQLSQTLSVFSCTLPRPRVHQLRLWLLYILKFSTW